VMLSRLRASKQVWRQEIRLFIFISMWCECFCLVSVSVLFLERELGGFSIVKARSLFCVMMMNGSVFSFFFCIVNAGQTSLNPSMNRDQQRRERGGPLVRR
jgi:uncharacterized membrane protein